MEAAQQLFQARDALLLTVEENEATRKTMLTIGQNRKVRAELRRTLGAAITPEVAGLLDAQDASADEAERLALEGQELMDRVRSLMGA